MFKIIQKGKVETVTADCVKPAHIERESETSSTQKHQMQPKPKPTAKKPAVIAGKPLTTRARSHSTITLQSLETAVNSVEITNTRSATLGVGPGPAIAPLPEHGCLTRQHFIKRCLSVRTLLLALTGRRGVFERTHAYPCI